MKLLALKNKKKGFTLLELLVVLAILAILIAIAVPVYKNQKEKAAITAHNANVRVLETAVESYRQDNGGDLPGSIDDLATKHYIKNVPTVPYGAVKGSKETKYEIEKDGTIKPGEVYKDGKLIPSNKKSTTTDNQ